MKTLSTVSVLAIGVSCSIADAADLPTLSFRIVPLTPTDCGAVDGSPCGEFETDGDPSAMQVVHILLGSVESLTLTR